MYIYYIKDALRIINGKHSLNTNFFFFKLKQPKFKNLQIISIMLRIDTFFSLKVEKLFEFCLKQKTFNWTLNKTHVVKINIAQKKSFSSLVKQTK